MKARRIPALLFLVLAWLPASAQSSRSPGPVSPVPKTNPAVAPGEPEIIMPQVILQVEDLSVEKIEAQLPPEEDLLPPVRAIPALSEGELAVGEPTIPAAPVESEGPSRLSSERPLSSEVQLGAGSMNMISGRVALKTLGPDPRFSLQFFHETLDGFGRHEPGSGYNLRNDSLDGDLKFRLGGADTDLGGSFKEEDTGLQGLGSYSSALHRAISGKASLSGSPLDWLTLKAMAEGAFDSLTLQTTQPAMPLSSSGLVLAPSLSADAKFGAVGIGLESRYWYRDDSYLDTPESRLHRLKIAAVFRLDLPATLILQASAAWFWNSDSLSLFPVFLSITGTPLDVLTISLEGGYKVVPYDMRDILSANALALPRTLVDDRGWYADASAQLSVTRDLAATIKVSFMASEAMPKGSMTVDGPAGTGLFPVTQSSGVRLSTNAGLRWGITQALSLSAGWSHEFIDRPFFASIDAITAGLLVLDPGGRLGGSITVSAGPIADGTIQPWPVVHVSGFWKITDAVKLQVDGDDLFGPLLSGPRWNIAPDTFITPGFRVSTSLGVSL